MPPVVGSTCELDDMKQLVFLPWAIQFLIWELGGMAQASPAMQLRPLGGQSSLH